MLTAIKSADNTYLIYVPYSCCPTYNFMVHPPGPCRILKRSLTRTGIGHDEFGDAPLIWSGLTIPLRGGLGDSLLLANEIYRRDRCVLLTSANINDIRLMLFKFMLPYYELSRRVQSYCEDCTNYISTSVRNVTISELYSSKCHKNVEM